jgi:fatty acid desaturase
MQFALAEAVLHEASHYNLFRSRHLHHRLQFLYAWPFMQTMNDYQAEHLAHHKYLMTERDQTSVDYKMYGLAKREPNLFFIWFIKPFTFYPTWHYLRHGNAALDRANWLPLGLFWIAVGGLFVALGQAQYFLLYWIVPLLWVYPILNYWSEIEEHYNTSDGSRSNLSRVINFLTHNEGYHTVHHRYPTIPFYNLPKAHAAFVGDESDISRGFLDTYRQLQAKRPEHV